MQQFTCVSYENIENTRTLQVEFLGSRSRNGSRDGRLPEFRHLQGDVSVRE